MVEGDQGLIAGTFLKAPTFLKGDKVLTGGATRIAGN
jgi:hypothetical protein